LDQYNANTEIWKKDFEDLKIKDRDHSKEIELQMKKLTKLQVNIIYIYIIPKIKIISIFIIIKQ